ncbi:MAG: hypothetical protein ACO321_02705 [Ilumatobacteraceae bacterium]
MRVRTLIVVAVALFSASSAHATVPPPVPVDSVPLEQSEEPSVIAPSPITVPSAVTTLPEGCAPAIEPQIVFVGEVLRVSESIVVYRVEQVRAGADLGGELGVEYGKDAQFLSTGSTYLVGAASDAQTGVLSSKVREERPLFGGDAVLGENDTAASCPTFEDPIRTLNVDGSEIPAGVLVGVTENLWRYVLVIVMSVLGAIVSLVGLVVWKRSLAGARKALRRK